MSVLRTTSIRLKVSNDFRGEQSPLTPSALYHAFMKLNPKYVNPDVSEDDERYFDFQQYNNDFKKKHYKRVSALIPKEDHAMITFLEEKDSVSSYIYNLIKTDMEKSNLK